MFWKKSILSKMLLGIGIPILLVLCVTAAVILSQVKASLNEKTQAVLQAQSEGTAMQISEFFTKYTELVRQISCNETVVQMLREIERPGAAAQAPSYQAAAKSLDNVLASDNQISLVWTADFNSGESVRSGGVVRGKTTDYDITARDWYQQALANDSVFLTEPYLDSSTGQLVASVICPVFDGAEKIGLVAIDLTIGALGDMMAGHRLGETGFFLLATGDGLLIYHPNKSLIGQNIADAQLSQNMTDAMSGGQNGSFSYTSAGTEIRGHLSPVGSTGWSVLSGLPEQEFNQSYREIQNRIFVIFTAGICTIVLFVLLISTGITRPLKRLAAAAGEIAQGKLDVAVDVHTQDETGRVAKAMAASAVRLQGYIDYIQEISGVLNEVAAGNLVFTLQYDYTGEFAVVKTALENISASLNRTLCSINESADQVASGAEQVSAGAQALSQGATEQASSVEQLAATINEISAQIEGTAGNAGEARNHTRMTGTEIDQCGRQMQDLTAAMREISESSGEIGKIIKTIEDIAFQTNILALNAAVEAARAGAAGKGFAVVADEVRNLASKSAEASANTSALIEGAVKSIEKGIQIADETAASLTKVVEAARGTQLIVDRIAGAAKEQSESIQQVTQGVDQISSVVQTNSATAQESAAASEQLSSQAQMLKNMVGQFKLRGQGQGSAPEAQNITGARF